MKIGCSNFLAGHFLAHFFILSSWREGKNIGGKNIPIFEHRTALGRRCGFT
jgi:hypothetical protein